MECWYQGVQCFSQTKCIVWPLGHLGRQGHPSTPQLSVRARVRERKEERPLEVLVNSGRSLGHCSLLFKEKQVADSLAYSSLTALLCSLLYPQPPPNWLIKTDELSLKFPLLFTTNRLRMSQVNKL